VSNDHRLCCNVDKGEPLKHLTVLHICSNLPGSLQVAGHAVYVGKDYQTATRESSWFLEDYQKIPGAWRLGWYWKGAVMQAQVTVQWLYCKVEG